MHISHDWYIFHENAKKKFSSAFTNNKLYTILFLYSGLISRRTVKNVRPIYKSATTEAQRVRTDLFETFQLLHRAARRGV